jgi:hypothetical protein
VLFGTGLRSLYGNRYVVRQPWATFAAELPHFLARLVREWALGLPTVIGIVLAVTAVIGAAAHRRLARDRVPVWLAAALWCALVLLVNRHVPFTRVWLFLLPLAAMLVGCGLVVLAQTTLRSAASSGPPAVATVLLTVGLGAVLLRSDSVRRTPDTGILPDAAAITDMLKRRLGPDDGVVADAATGNILTYYFLRANAPHARVFELRAAVGDSARP